MDDVYYHVDKNTKLDEIILQLIKTKNGLEKFNLKSIKIRNETYNKKIDKVLYDIQEVFVPRNEVYDVIEKYSTKDQYKNMIDWLTDEFPPSRCTAIPTTIFIYELFKQYKDNLIIKE